MENVINITAEQFRLKRLRRQVREDFDNDVRVLNASYQAEIAKLKKKRDDGLQQLAEEEGRIVIAYQQQKARMIAAAQAEAEEGGRP